MDSVVGLSKVKTSQSSSDVEKVLFPSEKDETPVVNPFIKACDKIVSQVNLIRCIGAEMGKELEVRSEMEKYKKMYFEMKRKVKKYELLLPMYKLEIKSLKNELEREKRRKILKNDDNQSKEKRSHFREAATLKIDQRRRKRSRSFRLRSPISMSPLSPTGLTGGTVFSEKI